MNLYDSSFTHCSSYPAEEPLLNNTEETREVSSQESLTIPQVYATIGLRTPLMIVTLAMLSQQLSGTCDLALQFSSVSL